MKRSNLLYGLLLSVLLSSTLFAGVSSSSLYKLDSASQETGGSVIQQSGYKIHRHALGSLVRLSPDAPQANQKKIFQGYYLSPSILSINGLSVYNREDKKITPVVSDLFINQIEYAYQEQGQPSFSSLLPGTLGSYLQALCVTWDTKASLPKETSVFILARAFDGLTWTNWFQPSSNSYIVDNVPPRIPSFNIVNPIFSPNGITSIGIKDFETFSFLSEEANFDSWKIDIYQNSNLKKSFTGAIGNVLISQVWDGTDQQNVFVPDNTYQYKLTLKDKLNWETVVTGSVLVDNIVPHLDYFNFSNTSHQINSSLSDLFSNFHATDQNTVKYTLSYAKHTFFPHKISGLTLWLDATDLSTLTLDASGYVAAWEDKSEYKTKFLSQGNEKPMVFYNQYNGWPSLSFDGVNDSMKAENVHMNGKPGTLVMMINQHQQNGDCVLLSKGNDLWTLKNNGYFSLLNGSSSIFITSQINAWDRNGLTYLMVTFDGTLLKAYQNGVFVAQKSINQAIGSDIDVFTLGSDYAKTLFMNADLGELIVYDRVLSDSERSQVSEYLDFKWGITKGFAYQKDSVFSSDMNLNWSKLNQPDSSFYQAMLTVEDEAGNSDTFFSNTIFSLDRTPPDISTSFTEIKGTEDINWVYDPTPFKSDNAVSSADLRWAIQMYSTPNTLQSAAEVFQAIRTVDNDDHFSFVLKPDANTQDPVMPGNRYAKSQAWAKVRLTDKEGNFSEKDIQLKVTPVNDAPKFIKDLGQNMGFYEGSIVFNFFMNEGEKNSELNLDEFVDDVDNLKSDLVFEVTGNQYYKASDATFPGSVFTRDHFKFKVGAPDSQHQLFIEPYTYFWGDEKVSVKVADSEYQDIRPFTVRVWPINQKPAFLNTLPLISQVNEDQDLVLSLKNHKSDAPYEDTDLNDLILSVDSYDHTKISLVQGNNGLNDIITFTPISNEYGTANVVLRLTDKDVTPSVYFNGSKGQAAYVPNPQFVTVNVKLVWYPVNDAPVIADLPDQIKNEDEGAWNLDLRPYLTDIEDPTHKLNVQILVEPNDLLQVNVDQVNKVLNFTTLQNKWGVANIKVAVTDPDDDIHFTPYTPNPITVTKNLALQVYPVNDEPYLSELKLSASTSRTDLAMSTDQLIAEAKYNDVGYANGVRNSQDPGDEYDMSRGGLLGFVPNSKLYHYRWFVDNELRRYDRAVESESSSFDITPDLEGKTVVVESWPDDGQLIGPVLTKSIKVNTRPDPITFSNLAPIQDTYFNVASAPVMSWNQVFDPDTQDSTNKWYRVKVWKKPKWGSPPEVVNINDSTVFYDSGWVNNLNSVNTTYMTKEYLHGTYFWSVWTGNKFDDKFDVRDLGLLDHFNVDLINPVYQDFSSIVLSRDIPLNGYLPLAGQKRVLIGTKPVDIDDGYFYRVVLEWKNFKLNSEGVEEVTMGSILVADARSLPDWSYEIVYPEGRTEYKIVIYDLAQNTGVYANPVMSYNFTVGNDITAPSPFSIFDKSSGQFTVMSSFSDTTSANYYSISGERDTDEGALFFEGMNSITGQIDTTQVVPFSGDRFYRFSVFSNKPAGLLYTKDKTGNVQPLKTQLNLRFVIGPPKLTVTGLNRTVINSDANRQKMKSDFNISDSQVDALTKAVYNWKSNRVTQHYEVQNRSGQVLAFDDNIPSGNVVSTPIYGNKVGMVEGLNQLVLKVWDDAFNMVSSSFNVTLKTKIDTSLNKVLDRSYLSYSNTSRSWVANVFVDKKSSVNAYVNNQLVTLKVLNTPSTYKLALPISINKDNVVVSFTDDLYNKVSYTIWDASYAGRTPYNRLISSKEDIALPIAELASSMGFLDGDQEPSIILDYASLPQDISGLYSKSLANKKINTGLSVSVQELAMQANTNTNVRIPDLLKDKMYQVYGRNLTGDVKSDFDLSLCDVRIGIPYPNTPLIDPAKLNIVMFDAKTGLWTPVAQQELDTEFRRVITTISTSGLYGLAEVSVFSENLDSLRVYPNPWVPFDNQVDNGTEESGIVFDQLTRDARIQLFTISGQLVMDVSPQSASWSWKGLSSFGKPVASGVYLYVVSDSKQKKTGKLTIIR